MSAVRQIPTGGNKNADHLNINISVGRGYCTDSPAGIETARLVKAVRALQTESKRLKQNR